MEKTARPEIYGVMAEFHGPDELLAAARRAFDAGYRRMDAYSPFPVEGLSDAVGFRKTRLPWVVLTGGIIGAATGYLMQYWTSAIDYPINVGGRPYNSVPYFIPVTFEMTILFAALTAVFGMLAANGLPMPYHPVFNVSRFQLASRDRFFLCIEARDPKYDTEKTKQFLESLNADVVVEVDH
jgi:hypothetical protein